MKRFFKTSYFAIIMAFIYVPIIIMIIYSFNSGKTISQFEGWSLKWYAEFFKNSPFIKSIITSLFVAIVSTTVSVIIGTLAAIGLSRVNRTTRNAWFSIANIPLVNADVITAVSLMVVFIIAGLKFGIMTLIAAHISFNVPYVLITVMPRLRKIDPNVIDASYDLGSSSTQTMFKIVLPILRPAIIAATAIAFAMSFDDFIISYFTGGDQTNVSTFIYTAKKIQPYINAFGTILVGVIVLSILVWNTISFTKSRNDEIKNQIKEGYYKSKQIDDLNHKLTILYHQLSSNQIVKKSLKPSLRMKATLLKIQIRILENKNYNAKISKLEWKKELISNEIKYEKRLFIAYEKSQTKMKLLEQQLLKNYKSHRKVRFQNAIIKLSKRIKKYESEIEWINERNQSDSDWIKELDAEILELQAEWNRESPLSKKDNLAYKKKIKKLQTKRDELKEGRNQLKLRLVLEKLKDVQSRSQEQLQELVEKQRDLSKVLFSKISLTAKIDKKIETLETKENKTENDFQILSELKQERIETLELKRQVIREKIITAENKIEEIQIKTDAKREKLFPAIEDNAVVSHNKGFFKRSWKTLLAFTLFASSFTLLTVAYVRNNIYDLVIGNWGSYINPEFISEFEKKYEVKVNYQQFDSNESLYNKLYTFNYDVMVPSDYMVQKLVAEDKLQNIDYNKVNIYGEFEETTPGSQITTTRYFKDLEGNEITSKGDRDYTVNADLMKLMFQSPTEDENEGKHLNHNITDYAIPYFWGDLVVVANPNDKVIKFLEDQNVEFAENQQYQIDSSTLSWDIFWKAAQAGLNVRLNEDAKNIFAIASEKMFGTIQPNLSQLDETVAELKKLILRPNVSLLGDNLIEKVALGDFDLALMYNGDAIYANQIYNGEAELEDEDDLFAKNAKLDKNFFFYGRPGMQHENFKEGTNVFSDNLVINKVNRNLDLSYKWINFMLYKSTELTEYVGITSPIQEAMDEVSGEGGVFKNYFNLYIPQISQDPNARGSAFQYSKKDEILNNKIIDAFNSLIAGKN
ncbi:spermidine/putrescine ABC transporter permease [Spiroplasma sabaudiense Ar-1343]|uniref:Spermidine/putrescine ABC transporter permease n=1 Tax=Spiroplasma sabaudiense Ar-1343 TaxID=1276257 RepID=W6A9H6_9MOLU|nr:spermidine/putrescine ABC transporter permease/substrate-binding protein [Spiroplasma sabaudiense]AHI53535.1 spermidine/putrescine ABC transporter permease [Spiroplasma sabaudiense Ar-1343]